MASPLPFCNKLHRYIRELPLWALSYVRPLSHAEDLLRVVQHANESQNADDNESERGRTSYVLGEASLRGG